MSWLETNITTFIKKIPSTKTHNILFTNIFFQILCLSEIFQGLSVASMAAVPLAGFPPTSLLPLSLLNLHIICWEEAEPAVAFSYPPTLVNHFNVGDDIIGIKRYFILCHCLIIIKSNSSYSSTSFLCIYHLLHIIINIIFLYGFSCPLRNFIFHVVVNIIFLRRHIIPCIGCLVLAFLFFSPRLFLPSFLLLSSSLFLLFPLFFFSLLLHLLVLFLFQFLLHIFLFLFSESLFL